MRWWAIDKLFERLLPAIRDTRLPLATGFGWLFAAWIAWGHLVPERHEVRPDSAQEQILRAFDGLGVIGTSIALSFVAYLVGSLIGYLVESTILEEPERKFTDKAARLLFESTLRIQIVLPITGIVAALAWWWALPWLLALIVPWLLVLHGWLLRRKALTTRSPPYEVDPSSVSRAVQPGH